MTALHFNLFSAHVDADGSKTFKVVADTLDETTIMIANVLRIGLKFVGHIQDAPRLYRGFKSRKDAQNAASALEQEARAEKWQAN